METAALNRRTARGNDAKRGDAHAHPAPSDGDAPECAEWLRSQRDLPGRLRTAAGGTQAEFERLYLPVLENCARRMRVAPAAPGALRTPPREFRRAVEVAFYALQASAGVIFSGRETAERRRVLEPRWRYAAFVAGLCAGSGEPWAARGNAIAATIAAIVPAQCEQYLREGGDSVFPAMLDAIAGSPGQGEARVLRNLVEDVQRRIAARDADAGALPGGGTPVPVLLDAMRRLYRSGAWKVGEKKARLWYAEDGLYLVWKTASNEIAELIRRERIDGLPQDANALRDILACAGVIEANPQGGFLWIIRPPNAANALVAVRIRDPEVLFAGSGARVEPLRCAIGRSGDSATCAGDR